MAFPRLRPIILLAILLLPDTAFAQPTCPDKPLHLVVPIAPGGNTNLSTEAVTQAPADGYTLIFAQSILVTPRR